MYLQAVSQGFLCVPWTAPGGTVFDDSSLQGSPSVYDMFAGTLVCLWRHIRFLLAALRWDAGVSFAAEF